MLWIMFAAQMSAVIPANNHVSDIRALFTYNDVPDYLLRLSEVSRTVYTRTTVRDDGSVQRCVAEQSSGDAMLDGYTCAIIVKRGKFAAAKWTDGSPAYSVLRFPVTYTVTESIPSEEQRLRAVQDDLELSVNQLPKGARKIVDITLEVGVDETGHIVSCGELPPAAGDPRLHFPILIPIACEQATKNLTLQPPLDPSGKPLRSVQTASVQMTLAQ